MRREPSPHHQTPAPATRHPTPTTFYGGQAVIEGVMMRGARSMAVAVRDPSGQLVIHGEPLNGAIYRSRWARWPFVRGAIALWDTLALGMRTLAFSADVAMGGEAEATAIEESKRGTQPVVLGSMVVALGLAVALFFLLPIFLTNLVGRQVSSAFLSNLIETVFRLALIIGYMAAISLMPDVQRVFGYHGAEHKTVNAYEAGVDLTVPNVRPFTLLHPRCGTTFLVIVVIISFLVFAILGHPPIVELVLSRILLIPVIAGIGYELIRLGATNYHRPIVRTLMKPGLAVQRLTTREPDDSMIEAAIAALRTVLDAEGATQPLATNPQRDF
ncbi:MAG TPA: DUF1385 domain-containing protein [Chloroflexota bacterium]|nr:DUF1385 domain-containing protein [Chloroflexota bacterium]